MGDDMSDELDFHEAAERLGVSWHTVRRRMKEGKLIGRYDENRRKWLVQLNSESGDAPPMPTTVEVEELIAEVNDLRVRLAGAEAERDALRLTIDRLDAQQRLMSDDHRLDAQRADVTLGHYRALVDALVVRIGGPAQVSP